MKVTFDFRTVEDADDCHAIFSAFGYADTMVADTSKYIHRVQAEYTPNVFGKMAGEAAVFAPVQITVE